MNSRLTMAAHILGMMAFVEREEQRPVTSAELAKSIGTNPVVVRRVLAQLQDAGLIESRRGPGGGSLLARDPRRIDLREVYEACEQDSPILGRHAGRIGPSCHVAPVISSFLDDLYADAEEALLRRLASCTVDEMSREIVRRLRREK